MDGKQVSKKLVGSEEERAVSPVIGVILMVAITVILAAVIAAFVLDLGDSVGEEPQAGVSVENLNSSHTEVSVTSLGNSDGVFIVYSNGTYMDGTHMNRSGASTVVETDVANNVVAYIGDDHESDDATTTAIASVE